MKVSNLVVLLVGLTSFETHALECTALKEIGQKNRFPTQTIQCKDNSHDLKEFTIKLPFALNNFDQSQLLVADTDFIRRARQLILNERVQNPNVREIAITRPAKWNSGSPIILNADYREELVDHMSRTLGTAGAIRRHWLEKDGKSVLERSVNKVCFNNTTVEDLTTALMAVKFCGGSDALWDVSACDNPTVWTRSSNSAESQASVDRKVNRFIPNNGRLAPPAPAMNIDQRFDCSGAKESPLKLSAVLRHTRSGKNSMLLVDAKQDWEFYKEGNEACFTERYYPLPDGADKGKIGAGMTSSHKHLEAQELFVQAHAEMVAVLTANMTERLRQAKGLSNRFGSKTALEARELETANQNIRSLPCLSFYNSATGTTTSTSQEGRQN